MYRVKAILIAAGIMAIATAAAYWNVSRALDGRISAQVEAQVGRAQQQLLREARLEGFDLANQAMAIARDDEFVQVFAQPSLADKQIKAAGAVEARKARLQQKGEEGVAKVGILGLVDAQGRLLARDLQPSWRRGEDLTNDLPLLKVALGGQPSKAEWNLDGQMYRVGAAPVKSPQGNVVGAVFLGYARSFDGATQARDLLGADVAYFFDDKIQASSFLHRGDAPSSEATEEHALAQVLFDGPKYADQALDQHQPTAVFHFQVGHDEWVAAVAPVLGNATPSKSGFAVLKSLTAAQAPTKFAGTAVLALGLLGVLMAAAAAVMTSRRFLLPLDKLESGVSEVINGNQDYVFGAPSEDYEGLANGLNAMVARLLGRPEPDEDNAGARSGATSMESAE